MDLFGTSGIRGDAEIFFTNQVCFDIGRTFSKFLDNYQITGPIAIGMDPRGSSPRIKKALEVGLLFEGREIFDEGATPIPSMNYLLKVDFLYKGSVMVTGSHIKSNLNGIKFFFDAEEILKKHEKEIEEIYKKIKETEKFKDIDVTSSKEDRARESYKEMLINLAGGSYPRWKVVVDPGDGAQSDTMPQVLKILGLEVYEINATIQGQFLARDTEVEQEFQELKDSVREQRADLGVGFDSDGDRAIFVNEKGEFIPGDYTASIIAKYASGYSLVTPISTSQVVNHLGKRVYRTKVGSPYVVETMKKEGSSIGFEPNGGCISAEIMHSRDGGSTTIKLLSILRDRNVTLSQLIQELPKFFLSKTKFDYDWSLMQDIYQKVSERYQNYQIDTTDGVKIWIDKETWLLFRSSLNAPEFRIFTESRSEAESKKLLEEGTKFVQNIINDKS